MSTANTETKTDKTATQSDHPVNTHSALGQAAYYAIGIVMMKGISLLMMPYVTRQLDPTQYGLMETLLVLADIGTIVIGFGLVEALYRFAAEQPQGGKRNQTTAPDNNQKIVASCLVLALLVTLFALLVLSLTADWLLAQLPAGLELYQLWLIAIPTFAEGLIAIPLTLMRMQALAKRFCFLNVFKALFQASLVIILLEAGWGIDAILIAGTVSSLVMVALLLSYLKSRFKGFNLTDCISQQDLIKISRYGGPVVVSRMGLFAITGLDRWLLADRVGVEQLAVYAIATKFALILGLLMQPFGLWWFPKRIGLLAQPGGPQKCADYALLGSNMGIFLAAAMVMSLPGFLLLVLPEQYHAAATIIIWLALINAIKNAGDLMNLGCFSGDSSQSQMWIQWVCALFAIGGYLWLIPELGVMAAIMVLAAVYSMRLVLFYWQSQRLQPLPYRHSRWLLCLTVSLLMIALSHLLAAGLAPVYLMSAGLVLSLILLLSLFVLGVFPTTVLQYLPVPLRSRLGLLRLPD